MAYEEEDIDPAQERRDYVEKAGGWYKKFYSIPEVEGTRHLDVGWSEIEGLPIIGATLGVDLGRDPESTKLFKSIGFQEIQSSGYNLPFADGTIDSVSSQHAIGQEIDTEEGILEAIRVLRSGGKLAILFWTTPEDASIIRSWLKSLPVKNVRFRKPSRSAQWWDEEDSYLHALYALEFTKL